MTRTDSLALAPVAQREPLTRDQPLTALTRAAALSEIYAQYVRFVCKNLKRLGVQQLSVEDAVQDVFLVVHRRLPEFQGRSQLQTWLFGIVLRVAHDYRRSVRRRQAHFVEGEPVDCDAVLQAEQDEPEALTARRQSGALLRRVLDTLDAMTFHNRAVFVLVEMEHMNVREAAEALGVTVRTAHWRLRAARAAFDAAVTKLPEEGFRENHPSLAPSAELVLDQKRARELLDSVLAEMPAQLRSVFILCEFEEMTMAATSAMLSLPTGTVASRLRRAREMFEDKAGRLRATSCTKSSTLSWDECRKARLCRAPHNQ